MSRWTHSICEACWNGLFPDRSARAAEVGDDAVCCYCGAAHTSGIFIREDPEKLLCKGLHPEVA